MFKFAQVQRTLKSLRLKSHQGLIPILVGLIIIGAALTAFIHDLDVLPSRIEQISSRSPNSAGFLPIVLDFGTGSPSVKGGNISQARIGNDLNLENKQDQTGNRAVVDSTDRGSDNLPVLVPQRIVIPAIDLDAPILQAEYEIYFADGREFILSLAPNEYAGGWHPDSAGLGEGGNTVINGHHNVYGEVFRDLEDLAEGAIIILYSNGEPYHYTLEQRILLQERYKSLETRLQNASWIKPTADERLTLVTCWPYEDNSYRLILIAKPMMNGMLQNSQ
jgi:LPXTG-site transpeptidase (sortase) family protein